MEDIKVDKDIEITVERQEELGFLDLEISAVLTRSSREERKRCRS
jgi:hypothetical protein